MGTGFMKCIPMTFSGRLVALPAVMEMEEVLEARIAAARERSSSERSQS
jgi:hypothetical protein